MDLFDMAAEPDSLVVFSNQNGIWSHRGEVRQVGLRRGDWKVMLGVPHDDAPTFDAGELERAYRLKTDRGERERLGADEAGELLSLLRDYDGHRSDLRPETLSGAGEDTHAMLIELGYVDEE